MSFVTSEFTFSHERLKNIDLNAFSDSFKVLVPDQYVEGNYRLRRYSQFTGQADSLKKLPHSRFVQSKSVNYLSGDIQREYPDLESDLVEATQFKALIKEVSDYFCFNPDKTVLGVHQIRILCSGSDEGVPVPEGIHQDGFDLIAICCIARHDIEGAETQLFQDPDGEPIYKCIMQPGDVIYCNDRKLYHYTAPIHASSSANVNGYRDVFVITVSLSDARVK
ncbi:2OG-Fe dioxygenase family protein [Endozoicomonas ascidiicola]|uniref:2OG-Fe dioxygenase family protein n=1 Tax=Endozoicomonas ascidiicola TaxID=1698521 RepID=UPI0012F81E02|nr:2OG-Fe dioxygenase family protein [Endozoicomonas ascidiicola]